MNDEIFDETQLDDGCISIWKGRSIPADNLLVKTRDLLPSGASPLRRYLQK